MRLNSDEYFKNISSVELHKRLSDIGEMKSNLTTDELKSLLENLERTRCIQLWHDGSTVANHSHILFSVNILYDVAVFYTDEEYENLYKEKMNLQGEIETPELYMIGRCASSDEQMGYVETRLEDLFELSKDLIIDDIKLSLAECLSVFPQFHQKLPESRGDPMDEDTHFAAVCSQIVPIFFTKI